MTTVIADMSMSLDGFVAGPKDEEEHVFGWYSSGVISAVELDGPRVIEGTGATHLHYSVRR